jgi:hypothetical protein
MAPGTEWDNPPLGEGLAEAPPSPAKKRWGRRKVKASAPPPPVTTSTAGLTAAPAPPAPAPPTPAPPSPAPPTIEQPATQKHETKQPAAPAKESTPAANGRPGTAAAPPPTTAPPPPAKPATGTRPPEQPVAATGDGAGPRPRRTSRLVVLGVALLAVIGAIAYIAVGRTSSPPHHSATPPSPPSPPKPPADLSLVASVNLRLPDLPPGWTQTNPPIPLRLPVANSTVESQATQTLASCLAVPVSTAAGLFADGSLTGQTAVDVSPTFVEASDPGIQMHSMTTALGTSVEAQAFATPFESPNFAACYGQFERTVVAAATPGATAALQVVTLAQPAGVKSFGYITTVTSPQGTQLFGQAFLIGGRLVTDLMPATNGPQIPTADFVPAYDAVSGRVAADVER